MGRMTSGKRSMTQHAAIEVLERRSQQNVDGMIACGVVRWHGQTVQTSVAPDGYWWMRGAEGRGQKEWSDVAPRPRQESDGCGCSDISYQRDKPDK